MVQIVRQVQILLVVRKRQVVRSNHEVQCLLSLLVHQALPEHLVLLVVLEDRVVRAYRVVHDVLLLRLVQQVLGHRVVLVLRELQRFHLDL